MDINFMNIAETSAGVLIAIVAMIAFEKAKDWFDNWKRQRRRHG